MLRARWKEELNGSYPWGYQKESDTLEALTYVDLTYNLNLQGLIADSDTRIELGARNLLDSYPKVIGGLGGIETYVHDPRGRTLFARVKHSF